MSIKFSLLYSFRWIKQTNDFGILLGNESEMKIHETISTIYSLKTPEK